MTRLLDIGISGLTSHQTALATTGHNIANAGVEGYSRQETVFSSRDAQFVGGGFVGSGVSVETIRRVTDRFVVSQVISDTTRANELGVVADGLEQLDQLLAEDNTGLSSVLTSLFNALQSASESPTSIPLRQQVLSEAERLVDRYQSVQGQLESLSALSGEVIGGVVGEINALASGIANVNQRIIDAKTFSTTDEVNDLLDQRDNLLRKLAEKVSFSTIEQDGDSINVFIGSGQPLVLGVNSNQLIVSDTQASSFEVGLSMNISGRLRDISGSVAGGELGGHLKLREQGLAEVADKLGLVQTLVVHNFNNIHSQGIDLNGVQGGDLFTSLNDPSLQRSRVVYAPGNASDNTVVSVSVDDPSALVGSSYVFALNGVGVFNYSLTRASDGVVVKEGILPNVFPQTIETQDGFSFTLESGDFANGDQFTLLPTRLPADNLQVLVSDPASLAFGLPVTSLASPGNIGTGVLSQLASAQESSLTNAELQAVLAARENTPPLLLRFTSDTSYDVLDNSDPLAPVDLVPPLNNLSFLPGRANPVLSAPADSQVLASSAAFSQAPVLGAVGSTSNGNPGETVSITTTDPLTSTVSSEIVNLLGSESAATAALRLGAVAGVEATANNEIVVSVLDDGVGPPLQVGLNGIDLTSATSGPVPIPVTADFLAGRINNLLGASGVVASAQGSTLNVRSVRGDDIVLQNISAGADTLLISSANGAAATTLINGGQEATTAGTVSLFMPANISVASSAGFFANSSAQSNPAFLGYDMTISGAPQAGDRFSVTPGSFGVGDNRNVLALAQLQTASIQKSGNASISDIYNRLIGEVGSSTSAARIDREAADSLLLQSQQRASSISGVNLDEEAARLLQYEQVYNASARIISIARSTFDTLIAAFS
ncbi:MAG: flagellar hook-associated protein FlgK [Pseudomonadales bacterium]|nr:flagellar hook-associated protein FlgK [Pseudomonadales bacterium]RZV56137.1 MAG: flagellar hook-associated protein FlgK [Pseudomonadales bacterium]